MKKIGYLLFLVFIITSCEKEDEHIDNKGNVTISSELYSTGTTYYVMGYSFELEDFVKSPGSNKKADFLPVNRLNVDGEKVGIYFEKVGNSQNGFYKNGDFQDLSEAREYYDNYTDVVKGPWESLTGDIQDFQVYTFKTTSNNYVKILIRDVNVINNMLGDVDHFEVDITYYIQRDGSEVFDE